MVYPIFKYIAWPVFSLFIKRIEGIENIQEKPCIYVCNHLSYIDGPIILMLAAWRKNKKVYTFATNEKFLGWFWDTVFEHFGAIRVNGSVKKGIDKIKQGKQLALFPEGARSFTHKTQEAKHFGLGVLALKTKVPIVPIGIDTYHFWNRGQKIPNFRKNIAITIGKPMRFKLKQTQSNYRRVTKEAMKEVKKLARVSHARTAAKL